MTHPHPFPATWWIEPGRLLGGCYPGALDPEEALVRLRALHDLGIRTIIALQPEDELGRGGLPFAPYAEAWRRIGGDGVAALRFPIPDMGVPAPATMRAVLDAIRDALQTREAPVYLHCWGGHGRTGTVAGCHLVESGLEPDEALRRIAAARRHDPKLSQVESPQTPPQRDFLRAWRSSGAGGIGGK